MSNLSKYIKTNVLALNPYASARDTHDSAQGILLDANENPYDLAYSRYPDPYQRKLKEAISDWRGVAVDSIFLGNGSDEIIDLLISTTCKAGNERILTLDPSYGMYTVSAAINEIPIDLVSLLPDMTVDVTSLMDQIEACHRLIFICSPNNPNGGTIEDKVIEAVLDRANGLVVIDEAYIDFSDRNSWIEKLSLYENLIVLQTFSKSLGAAGLRVGMGFMNPYLVQILNKVKPPYNISTPCQELALQRLGDMAEVNKSVRAIKSQREAISYEIAKLPIVQKVFPSQANFLLVRFIDHAFVYQQLLNKGIIPRDRSTQNNCQGCLRISIGTPIENAKLLQVLKQL